MVEQTGLTTALGAEGRPPASLVETVGSVCHGVVMSDPANVLMLSAAARFCPDCLRQSLFVPVDDCDGDRCEFCCTSCGAAIMIDPIFIETVPSVRVA